MATKRKKPSPEEIREGHLRQLRRSCDERTTYVIECCVCDEGYVSETVGSNGEAAEEAYDEGWRYGESNKFGVAGVMCPGCFNLPDEERGE